MLSQPIPMHMMNIGECIVTKYGIQNTHLYTTKLIGILNNTYTIALVAKKVL